MPAPRFARASGVDAIAQKTGRDLARRRKLDRTNHDVQRRRLFGTRRACRNSIRVPGTADLSLNLHLISRMTDTHGLNLTTHRAAGKRLGTTRLGRHARAAGGDALAGRHRRRRAGAAGPASTLDRRLAAGRRRQRPRLVGADRRRRPVRGAPLGRPHARARRPGARRIASTTNRRSRSRPAMRRPGRRRSAPGLSGRVARADAARALKVPISWTELAKRTYREVLADDCLGLAAQLAYYFFLALFPALLFLVAIVSFIPVAGLLDAITGESRAAWRRARCCRSSRIRS